MDQLWDISSRSILNKCNNNIDLIFILLNNNSLIQNSKFSSYAKDRIIHSCFYNLYPLIEYLDVEKDNNLYFYYNSLLYAYMYFLDISIDDNHITPSQKVRSSQISQFLLIEYYKWLKVSDNPVLLSQFYDLFIKQSVYLIQEKKWDYPDDYINMYCNRDNILAKGILELFPMMTIKSKNISDICNIFYNYYSFILLSDDIMDFTEDISNHIITYPIALYFKQNNKFPEIIGDMNDIVTEIQTDLSHFSNQIELFENKIGIESKILNVTLLNLKSELLHLGVEIE